MAFSRRSLLETSTELNETTYCPEDYCISVANDIGYCPQLCNLTCPELCSFYPSYSPPLYTPPPPLNHKNHSISPHIIILVSIFGGVFLLVCCFAIIMKFRANLRRSSIQSNNTHEDFIDVNRGPVIDHPIWLITTVGLQDSIINAITVCKYKREGGLIEGTECSVCLNGFQDDETLRLLPKCSHAFHLLCIDTWLRSHTNCPLCRAPIVSNPSGSPLTSMVPSLNNLSSGNETVENHQSNGGFGSDQTVDGGLNDIILGIEDEGECRFEGGRSDVEMKKEGVPSFPVNCEFRVFSDLSENHRVMENEIQPVRRSVSMDSASASLILLPMATDLSEDLLESSDNQLIEVTKSNSGSIQES